MANRLNMAEHNAILGLARLGWSFRRIAAELGVDRDTVARHLTRHRGESSAPAAPGQRWGARRLTARDVIRTLARLFAERGAPRFLRSDNGPEFIAQALRDWLPRAGVQTLYITPGAPWENAYSESLNSRLRDELLNRELFTSVLEAKVITEDYRQEYNQRRPHSALGYQTVAAAPRCHPARATADRSLGALPPNPRLQSRTGEHRGKRPGADRKRGPTLIATGT